MRKVVILSGLLILLSACWSFAQNDSHYSLFEYSQNVYNPGAAGANNAMCITSMHRQQWVGFEGRPQTTIFTFDMPIKDFLGLGAVVMQETIGSQNDVSFMINGAYRHEFDFGVLGAGVSLGLLNRNIDGDWKTPESLEGNPVYTDTYIPHKDSKATFDMHLGATLYGKDFWAGISVSHLTKPYINYDGVENATYIARHYYIAGGYNWTLPNPSSDLLFSAMAVYASTFEFQINAKYLYEKKFWGGLSYRFSDAIVPMLGIHLACGISIGYSYDIPIGGNTYKYNSGSHEIMVRYCFNVSKNNNMGRYRSVRRL